LVNPVKRARAATACSYEHDSRLIVCVNSLQLSYLRLHFVA